jgi:flagellar hook-associated protein 1 FlgK
VPTKNLFTYNAGIGAAATLATTDITGAELAAAAVGDPGGNTNALNLVDLQTSGIFGGLTSAQYFAELTSNVGDRLNAEKSNGALQKQLLQQAQSVRAEFSGVDINIEATKLLQLQKGFQAAGQVMSVLNSLTDTLINMLR